MKTHYLILVGFLGLIGCTTSKTSLASYYSYETECLGLELDGSQTLRAWGEGNNKADAVEQAKKNAVYDVVFKGIRAGKAECNVRPLLTEVNARNKHEDYFNKFFADKGEYAKYVSMQDEKINSKASQKNKIKTKYGITVRVLRSELKSRLQTDGLIK